MRIENWPVWAAVMLALAVGPAVARADAVGPGCSMIVASALSTLMHGAPDAVVFEYRGGDAARGIGLFNALPPTGSEHGDRFYIAVRPAFPLSRLIVGDHGCVANAILVDLRVAMTIKKAIKRATTTIAMGI